MPDVPLDAFPEAERRDRDRLPWDAHQSVTAASDAWDDAHRDAAVDAILEAHRDGGAGKWADREPDGQAQCELAVLKQPELADEGVTEAAPCKQDAGRSAAQPCDESAAVTRAAQRAAEGQRMLWAAGPSGFEPVAASRMRARFQPEAARSDAAPAELPWSRRAELRSRPDAAARPDWAAEL